MENPFKFDRAYQLCFDVQILKSLKQKYLKTLPDQMAS